MGEWADFYERLFNFREIRYFDIEGQVTGVKSKAMTSPCGKIRIPINEEGKENPGQIQEYLDMYRGEGIQHIAMGSDDLYHRGRPARQRRAPARHHRHLLRAGGQTHSRPRRAARRAAQRRKILIDGKKDALLLQIFSENQLGPIFFEFIQRKGDDGFGNGNFKALFEASSSTRCAAACSRAKVKTPGASAPRQKRRQPWPSNPSSMAPATARRVATTAAPCRLHLRAGLRPLHRGRTTTPTGACTRASRRCCRAGQRGLHRRPALAGRARPHSAL
jgi:hypothetical protein